MRCIPFVNYFYLLNMYKAYVRKAILNFSRTDWNSISNNKIFTKRPQPEPFCLMEILFLYFLPSKTFGNLPMKG